jgi:hypothetical protein
MELTESIDKINARLKDYFGIDTITGAPIWRVVFSEDQYEKRYGTFDDISPAGIYIRTVTEVRLVPKYKQWIHQKYILEQLVVVPAHQMKELADNDVSYEPLWVFQDKDENYLPPVWEAIEFIIVAVHAAKGNTNTGIARYVDPAIDPEFRKKQIDGLMEQLWGDESSFMLGTKIGDVSVVPSNYEKSDIIGDILEKK